MNKLTSGGKPPVTYGSAVVLGKQGEYGYGFEYDFTDWVEAYGAGSVGWTIKRPTDASAYLLPHDEDGNVTSITITETELQYAGHGKLEVFYVNDGETQKRISVSFTTVVFDSMMDIGEVPEPWEAYVDAVHADAVAAEEAREANENMSATASVDDQFGTPAVEVTKSLVDDHVNLDFAFSNLRGNGITGIELISTSGLNKTYRITMNEGHFDFTVHDGDGIESVTKTSSSGLYDTYTILFESGISSTFVIKNGNGITEAELNPDYTLTLTFNEGSYTTPSIRGEKGETGNVNYATFEVNPTTGILSMTYDDTYSGANFALTNDGYLEVII